MFVVLDMSGFFELGAGPGARCVRLVREFRFFFFLFLLMIARRSRYGWLSGEPGMFL